MFIFLYSIEFIGERDRRIVGDKVVCVKERKTLVKRLNDPGKLVSDYYLRSCYHGFPIQPVTDATLAFFLFKQTVNLYHKYIYIKNSSSLLD